MERRVILSTSLAHASTHTLELTFAALLLRIGMEFGADLASLGVVANIGTFTFGMTALPSGYLSDRFGPRVVMSSCMAAGAIFAGLVAVSPNVPVLALSLALLGAAIGLYHPAGVAMVATVRHRRGLAFAAHGIAGNIGVALAPVIGIGIAIAFGWRASYLALMLLALTVAVLVWKVAPTREQSIEMRRTMSVGEASQRSIPPEHRRWLAPPLLLIFACSVGMGFIYRGSLTFLPVHLERNLGLSFFGWTTEAVAGTVTTAVLLTAIIGQAIGGILTDRIQIERAALPIVLINVPMLALLAQTSGVALTLFSAGFIITNFAQQPVFNGLLADYAPEGAQGRAFGVSFFLTFGVGSIAGSIAGLVAERAGTEPMFYMLSAVGAALATGMVIVAADAERRRRQLHTTTQRE